MAVYTEVAPDEAGDLIHRLGLGQLLAMQGCAGGIENTNYFVSTDQGEYVLTLFERLSFEQLPFYLALMKHLAGKGIPVPDPASDADGTYLHRLKGKPATVVNKLAGKSALAPDVHERHQRSCAGGRKIRAERRLFIRHHVDRGKDKCAVRPGQSRQVARDRVRLQLVRSHNKHGSSSMPKQARYEQ